MRLRFSLMAAWFLLLMLFCSTVVHASILVSDLQLLPGSNKIAYYHINNKDQVIGSYFDYSTPNSIGIPRSILYENGVEKELNSALSDKRSLGINNIGDIVGGNFTFINGIFKNVNPTNTYVPDAMLDGLNFTSINDNQIMTCIGLNYSSLVGSRSYIFDGIALSKIGAEFYSFEAKDINNNSTIVGSYRESYLDLNSHGFIYRNGEIIKFDFPGSTSTVLSGINNLNQIVGSYDDNMGSHSFMFDGNTFHMIDISGTSGTLLRDINDNGVVLGVYFDSNYDYSKDISFTYSLNAVPIPPAVWLLGSGLVGLVGARKKISK